jgi:hypothetical protein
MSPLVIWASAIPAERTVMLKMVRSLRNGLFKCLPPKIDAMLALKQFGGHIFRFPNRAYTSEESGERLIEQLFSAYEKMD